MFNERQSSFRHEKFVALRRISGIKVVLYYKKRSSPEINTNFCLGERWVLTEPALLSMN
jgi:hypothetical protein